MARPINGFGLIDALVALAILAVALAAAFRGLGAGLLLTEESRLRQMATWVAENRLAEIRAQQQWPEVGRHQGEALQGKHRFLWVEEVKPTPNRNFRRVEIAVSLVTEAGAGTAPHALSRLSGYATQEAAL